MQEVWNSNAPGIAGIADSEESRAQLHSDDYLVNFPRW